MYKVGVMLMGKKGDSPTRVKEVILEVQLKTKIVNIMEYLLQMKKIGNMDVSISIQKNGNFVSEQSTISQALKYVAPVSGLIRLYLYEGGVEDQPSQQQLSSVKVVSQRPSGKKISENRTSSLKESKRQQNTQNTATKTVQTAQKEDQSTGCCGCC